jgi:hypothetical protein
MREARNATSMQFTPLATPLVKIRDTGSIRLLPKYLNSPDPSKLSLRC